MNIERVIAFINKSLPIDGIHQNEADTATAQARKLILAESIHMSDIRVDQLYSRDSLAHVYSDPSLYHLRQQQSSARVRVTNWRIYANGSTGIFWDEAINANERSPDFTTVCSDEFRENEKSILYRGMKRYVKDVSIDDLILYRDEMVQSRDDLVEFNLTTAINCLKERDFETAKRYIRVSETVHNKKPGNKDYDVVVEEIERRRNIGK